MIGEFDSIPNYVIHHLLESDLVINDELWEIFLHEEFDWKTFIRSGLLPEINDRDHSEFETECCDQRLEVILSY